MGRRRAENLCASLILSRRAICSRKPPSLRYTSNDSEPPRKELPRPRRDDFRVTSVPELGIDDWVHYSPSVSSNEPPPKTKRNGLPNPRVAVLGGGLTGLTTAFYLAKKLPPTSKIIVYEAGDRWGGWIKSQRTEVGEKVTTPAEFGSVLFERGPRLISLAPTQGRLDKVIFVDILETLGLMPVHPPTDLPRYMWHTRLRRLNSIRDILTAPAFWKGLTEVAVHQIKKLFTHQKAPPTQDISVAALIYSALGSRTLVDVPISALMHGIWGGDPYKLSAISATGWMYDKVKLDYFAKWRFERMQKLQEAPHGSFFHPKKEYDFAKRFLSDIKGEGRTEGFMSLLSQTKSTMAHVGPHGLESLPLGIADMLESAPNVELRLGSPVQHLGYSKQRSKVQVHEEKDKVEEYDKVVSTLPATKLSEVTDGKLPLKDFRGVSIMTVNLWYPQETITRGVGHLIPANTPYEENPERGLGVFYDSCAGIGEKPETAPEKLLTPATDQPEDTGRLESGTKLFVLMGGHLYDRDGVKPPSTEEAIQQAKALVERHLGISDEYGCHAVANLAEDCLPQHNVGHYTRLTALHDELETQFEKRLAVAGGSYTKPGVAGALRAGYDIADTIANDEFLATGLEEVIEPEIYTGTPMTIVDGSKDNDLFVELIGGKRPKGDR